MKRNPIYYDEARELLRRLSGVPEEMLAELLSVKSSELDELLLSMYKLLSAYVQVSDDLNEIQEG
jgi:hypothetical protein